MKRWTIPVLIEIDEKDAGSNAKAEEMVGSALEDLIILNDDGDQVRHLVDIGFSFKSEVTA